MADERLRELERRWKETNSLDDEAAFLAERVRIGALPLPRVRAAADLGHAAAQRLCPKRRPQPSSPGWQVVQEVQGSGFLDPRGDDFDQVLLIDDQPAVLNWADCQGSIGQYLLHAGVREFEDHLGGLRHSLESGLLGAEFLLGSQLDLVLQLLASGTYEICFEAQDNGGDWGWIPREPATGDHVEYYPLGLQLIELQSRERLDQARVQEYAELLQEGLRPTLLTLCVEGALEICEFLIDGHHKLAAYAAAGRRPTVLRLVRLNAPRISAAEGLRCFPHGRGRLARHYKTWKREDVASKREQG